MSIIRAIVETNSTDDKYARVKLKAEGIWKESELIESVGSIPLKKGDVVFVDISAGIENPLIVGKSHIELSKFSSDIEGSVLFESSDGSNYAIAFVKNNKLVIKTNNATIELDDSIRLRYGSSSITISDNKVDINNGTLTIEA